MAESVTIKARCAGIISYARFQNGMRAVERIIIKNTSDNLLTGLELSVESDPGILYPYKLYIGDIKPGGSVILDDIRADISSEYIAELTEMQDGVLNLCVKSKDDKDFVPVTSSHKITILPYDQWEGVAKTDELLASYCVPNHPDVKIIVREAVAKLHRWDSSASMDGYSSGSSERVKMQAAAIFEALRDKGISYAMPPATFYKSGQRIRMPEEVLSTRLATCMDSAMLYASCLESAGLRPLIILNRAHAYTAVWLDDEATSPFAVNDDPALLRKRTASGINQLLAIETTFIDPARGHSFDEAVWQAEKTLAHIEDFECCIDIHEARKLGVNPLPLRVHTPEGYVINPMEAPGGTKRPESLSSTDVIDLSVTPSVDKQTIWERKLLDLTLRNNLINIHPRYILQMMDPEVQSLVSSFENGRSMQIGGRPDGWEGDMASHGIYTTIPQADKMSAFCDAELRDGRLRSFTAEGQVEDRVDSLRQAAKRSIEENGANTLYLTVGALKWIDEDHKREHFAPIILMPCEIIRQSGRVMATGEEPVINLTLLEMLRENFGITIPGLDTLPQKEGHTDVHLILNTIRRAVMEKKGWDVDPLVFLGNFTFSKFIIWNDVHTGRDVFAQHPIIDGFKRGRLSEDAVASMMSEPYSDESCDPKNILLPISADSSQMKAIRDALEGKSFIMQGPPGTGKSQTITNIIANSLYHGKRVLFVSEKKAALDVVNERLKAIGLGSYCLELHSNKAVKSLVLSKLAATLDQKGTEAKDDFTAKSADLSQLRDYMNSHVRALHADMQAGMTLYEAISKYIASDKSIPARKLPSSMTATLSAEKVKKMQAAVRDYAAATQLVSMDEIRDLLDLPLTEYTPVLEESLRAQMHELLATGNPLLFRIRSRKLSRVLGFDVWDALVLKKSMDRRRKMQQWHNSLDSLRDYAIYNSRRAALRSCGLGAMASDFEQGAIDCNILPDFLMKSLHHSIAKDGIAKNAGLSMFNGKLFGNKVADYREAEMDFSQSCRDHICSRMASVVEKLCREVNNPELMILKKAIHNGARGMSLRTLFSKIPGILPRISPCMLMSPLSVSQYLTAQAGMFDIVIFDEASQMQTCEAISSIGRGQSLVVAGDPKQLPPTTFFETLTFDMDNADKEDLESVLEDCISLSVPSNTLRWHYRSRHESLIAFSNAKYYDNSLLTFPSPDDLASKVTLQKVKGEYERGASRQNKKEADAVVAEIKKRLQNSPHQSIGVITFSQPQQMAVEKRLETMLSKNPGLEKIASAMHEPIFVKNLENVQGDERDVILFSVGYGADDQGRLPMNFGPLNQHGGWRRLNVAVSRAREEMKVFASMSADSIRVDYNTPLGVVGLRDFLRYADKGRETLEERGVSDADRYDAYVEKIAQELRQKGLEVNTHVGASDFRIDIAVLDPEKEGCYSYGIICDGVNYANAQSAIDREIIRPSVLESLGWKIERRWILDQWQKM